jgi:hypothetical protein
MKLSPKHWRAYLSISGGPFLTQGFLFLILTSPRREFLSVIASSSLTFSKTAEETSSDLSKDGNPASRINKLKEFQSDLTVQTNFMRRRRVA